MAIEGLVSAVWELEGYLTRVRWPVATERGQYSDIDVVGVSSAAVRVAECKARGAANAVLVMPDGVDLEAWLGDWADSLVNVQRLWTSPPEWLPRGRSVHVEFWYCANVWFPSEDVRTSVDAQLTAMLASRAPKVGAPVVGRFYSTLDVLLMAIRGVRKSVQVQGRRFGNPILDILRELVRYTAADPKGGGRGLAPRVVDESMARLTEAIKGS
ncbi:MAG: hypothetical protein ABL982_13295 [Vicinamibacterales bacterium]